VTAELRAYRESIDTCLGRVCAHLEASQPKELNWRPPADGANSVYAMAAHIAGNARAWALGIACGVDLRRDRPGEFASAGDDPAALIARISELNTEIERALEALDPARLDVRLVPSQELWGEGPPREISVRGAILEVIEHAWLHLGHIQLTRDLWRARAQ
jgi:hypothetical protein